MESPRGSPEPRDECEHGSLRRSCELCERDAEIQRLRARVAALETSLALLLDLGPEPRKERA